MVTRQMAGMSLLQKSLWMKVHHTGMLSHLLLVSKNSLRPIAEHQLDCPTMPPQASTTSPPLPTSRQVEPSPLPLRTQATAPTFRTRYDLSSNAACPEAAQAPAEAVMYLRLPLLPPRISSMPLPAAARAHLPSMPPRAK